MKKLFVLALGASMFIGTVAHAQKQAGGEKNLQVLFAPLGGSPVSLNGIAFRKFNAAGTAAWRVNLFIGMSNKTEILEQAGDTVSFPTTACITTFGLNPQAEKRTSSMTLSLRPGYEKHFAGTDRLSPYWGVEALFSLTTTKVETDNISTADVTFTNNSTAISAPYTIYTTTRKGGSDAGTTLGINLLAGFDYYIAKNLSLGAEFGFGFSTTSTPDLEDQTVQTTTVSTTNTAVPPVTTTTVTHTIKDSPAEVQGSSWQLGPNVVGQFKLGWLF